MYIYALPGEHPGTCGTRATLGSRYPLKNLPPPLRKGANRIVGAARWILEFGIHLAST